MAQVSQSPVSKNIKIVIQENFRRLISSLKKSSEVDLFLQDFLTKTEKIMLAKRLAVAFMLEKNYSYNEIEYILKVSPSTIAKIQQILESGKGYQVGVKKLMGQEELDMFWKEVRKMVHMIGKGKRVFG